MDDLCLQPQHEAIQWPYFFVVVFKQAANMVLVVASWSSGTEHTFVPVTGPIAENG